MAHLALRAAPRPAPVAQRPSQAPARVSARALGPQPAWSASVRATSRPHKLTATVAATASGGSAGGSPGASGAAAPNPRGAAAAAAPAAAVGPGAGSAAAAAAAAATVRDDFAVDQRPIILFDGVCNLCNRGVNFMLDNDPRGAFRLAALQSPAGRRLLRRCGRSPDDLSSIVLVERTRHFIRSEAILRIGAALRVPLPLLAALGFPVPLPLRDTFYDAIANNRYSFFGRTDACRLRDAGKFTDRFVVD